MLRQRQKQHILITRPMSNDLEHSGVKGMRWRHKGYEKPIPPQNRVATDWSQSQAPRPPASKGQFVDNFRNRTTREQMTKAENWIQSKPPIMQQRVSFVSNLFADAQRRKDLKAFLQRQGINT